MLSDPERRARYDLEYARTRQLRWHAAATSQRPGDPIEVEQTVRVTVLEVLYERRRTEPGQPGVFILDLEDLTGQPREHLEFTTWYLIRRNFVSREDGSKLAITVDGVDYLESHHQSLGSRKRIAERAASA